MNLDKALDRAKVGVMMKKGSVFIATVAFSMRHKFDSSIPTAQTDGYTIKYNPEFFGSLTYEQRVSLICHEAWHVALLHLTRQGKRNPEIWNYAGDYVINQLLVDNKFDLPPNGLQDDKYRGWTTVQVYDDLEKNAIKIQMPDLLDIQQPGGGQDGEDGKNGQKKSKAGQKAAIAELENHLKGMLVKAHMQNKMAGKKAGKVPNEIERLIDELINPRLSWRDILSRFLTEKVKDDYTWHRPNKRFAPDYYLPTQYSEALAHITVAIDTSGSITPKQLTAILSEIQYIRDTLKPKKMTILDCDSKIHNIYEATEDQHIKDFKFSGGGGTRCEPVLKYCEKNPTTALVYFTDMYMSLPEKDPGYPILWIAYDNPKATAPIGEVVHYDEVING